MFRTVKAAAQAFTLAAIAWGCSASPASAESYALLIGNNEFQQSEKITPLLTAEDDARALGSTVMEVCGFRKENTRVLLGSSERPATRNQVLTELNRLADQVKPGDTVFLFIVSHGLEIEGKTYVLPWDVLVHNRTIDRASAIEVGEIQRRLRAMRPRVLIEAFDICRNDPLAGNNGTAGPNRFLKVQTRNVLVKEDQQTLTATFFACSPQQRSWEWREKGRGYFSLLLERGLRGEAADARGEVSLLKLKEYLEAQVPAAVAGREVSTQDPVVELSGIDAGQFVLARPGNMPKIPAPADHEKIFLEAFAQFDKQDFKRAAELFRKVSELRPQEPQAFWMLGNALKKQNDLEGAESVFRQLTRAFPDYALGHAGLANLLAAGDPKEAERLYLKAISLEPAHPGFLNNLGVFYEDQGQLEKAEERYRQAIALDARGVECRLNLGLLFERQGQFVKAVDLLRGACSLDEEQVHARSGLARSLKSAGCYAEAEQQFLQVLKVDKKNAEAAAHLGDLFRTQRKLVKAEEWFRKAAEYAPNAAAPMHQLGSLLLSLNRPKEAVESLRRASDLEPSDPDIKFDLGLALQQSREWTEAETVFQRLVDTDPKNAPAATHLAEVLLERGKLDGAETWFNKAMELDGQASRPVMGLAGLRVKQKAHTAAVRLYETVIKLDPQDGAPHNELGSLYANVYRDWMRALQHYRDAVRLDPSNGLYHANLGGALLHLGRRGEAVAEAERARSLGFREPHPLFELLGK